MNSVRRAVQAGIARINAMTGEQILEWLDANKPIFSCQRREGAALQTVREYAERRLDILTSSSKE
jgi:hypothetical protein